MLHSTFSATSQACLIELQQQLQSITCAEYIQKLRSLADELTFIGSPVSDHDLVNYTLCGLGTDFNPLVLAVTARSDPISLPNLHVLLLTTENRLNSQHSTPSLPAAPDPTAFYSNTGPRSFTVKPDYHPRPFNFSGPRPPSNFNPRNNYRPNTFHPRPNTYNSSRPSQFFHSRPPQRPLLPQPSSSLPLHPSSVPVTGTTFNTPERTPCQICGRRNHQARNCYYRFDTRYSDPAPSSYPYAPAPYHTFVAQPSSKFSPYEWCIDSGATHHITPELNNLSSFVAFNETDTLQIGNGMGMSISHIGTSSLTFSTFTIKLLDVLHVPQFTNNLLSLFKLLHDNSLFIEFSSTFCTIKDRQSKTLLIQAPLSNGLYLLHLPSTISNTSWWKSSC
jgi:gag-polypeptide of LTR copia-type